MSDIPHKLLERRLRVDAPVILRYAHLTNDYNPIHLDAEFAVRTPMGGIIAHGMLSLNLIWQSLTATFGLDAVEKITLNVRFVRPVRLNTLVTAGGTRRDDESAYDVWASANGDNVIEGIASLGTLR